MTMKRQAQCIFAAMILLVTPFLGAHSVNAQGVSDVVVVDMQQLEGMSVAGKALREKIKARRNSLKAEIDKEEKALRAEQSKLLNAKASMSAEEFKAKAMAFEANFKDKQAKFVKKREAFEKSAIKAHSELRSKVVEVVGTISNENKYKLVLSRQNVVIVEKTMDITSEAMKKLNAKVKSIPFK